MGVYRRESRYHGEICSLFFCAMPTSRDTAGDYGKREDYGRREKSLAGERENGTR